MKLIHCADIHLGAACDTCFDRDKARDLRREIRAAFSDLAEYAKRENISAVLIAGDLFDGDRPQRTDKEFFYSLVKNNPQTTFFYLRGNHDARESYTEELENLKTFGESWTKYFFDNVCICGAEAGGDGEYPYSSLDLDRDSKNIVMLHGTAAESAKKGEISLKKLRNKNIDYLALGHIHSFSGALPLDNRGVYAYSGCLTGRGFDETGEKGFAVVDTDTFKVEFVPFARRTVRLSKVDITAAHDDYGAYKAVLSAIKDCPPKDMLRVVLTGERDFGTANLAKEIEKRLSGAYFAVSVRDETHARLQTDEIAREATLRGEFVRLALADGRFTRDEREEIIAAGLAALGGGEI